MVAGEELTHSLRQLSPMALAGCCYAAFCVLTVSAVVVGAPTTQDSLSSSTPALTTAAAPEAPIDPMEEECLRAGGMCLLEADCPEGRGSTMRGLCPKQQGQGVECCHGLSVKERRCSARGGVCRPKHKCGRSLWEENADNCKNDETCCILVK